MQLQGRGWRVWIPGALALLVGCGQTWDNPRYQRYLVSHKYVVSGGTRADVQRLLREQVSARRDADLSCLLASIPLSDLLSDAELRAILLRDQPQAPGSTWCLAGRLVAETNAGVLHVMPRTKFHIILSGPSIPVEEQFILSESVTTNCFGFYAMNCDHHPRDLKVGEVAVLEISLPPPPLGMYNVTTEMNSPGFAQNDWIKSSGVGNLWLMPDVYYLHD